MERCSAVESNGEGFPALPKLGIIFELNCGASDEG